MDMTSGRTEGVSSANVEQYQGPNADGLSMCEEFKMVGPGNPGPTANLRGVSSNTSLTSGVSAPSWTPGGDQNILSSLEIPGNGTQFTAPDSTGLNSSLTASPTGWNGPDTKNVRPISIVQDSYDEMGEHYPGNAVGVDDAPY